MSNRILPILLSLLLVPIAAPAPAGAAPVHVKQSRLGRGIGRAPGYGRPRYRTPRYPAGYRRPFTARRFFGGVLKALGIAYLFHLLFGWGAGGSPFGLFLLLGLILLFVTRRRRRPLYY